MRLDVNRVRQCLKDGDFKTLFIEELGWDRHNAELNVTVDGQTFTLTAIAEKRGMVAFQCSADILSAQPAGSVRYDYATRRKIEREVAKSAHEHVIIYTDAAQTTQIWQWVKREAGKPTACREHHYHRNQPGDALIQKLQAIAFSLEEEEDLTIVDVTRRARAAFDVERVTRRFYDRFKQEHTAFLKFQAGIPDEEMQRWYVSVMLNRLMFIYFIQKKGFLDGDENYLRNKLNRYSSLVPHPSSFYKDFLCPLFFEGFAKKESDRSDETNRLLGKVPYLNGGIFQRHQIEELYGKQIQIPDAAFERLFAFFEQYHWHLDERPLRADNEINPDVLGYIFEKYINQKQMGAYYTKEDITEYISKNTILPVIFDAVAKKCPAAFKGERSVWSSLKDAPDRYLYEAVRRGVVDEQGNIIPETVLPDFVQRGMNDPKARMSDKRYNLGEADLRDPAGNQLTLPTETWREYVQRRQRCLELRERLAKGEISDINDLITYNLDIRQFAQDVIEDCETPELLRAFYRAIKSVTVLDPTCGSGAFLFAALNILEPLYDACLNRMAQFVADYDRSADILSAGRQAGSLRYAKFRDFREELERVAKHPNRRYFILKSIIVNNLYGVDIMEEAVEICKLRLFLKLVAQVERVEDIEPLPDIDFNIRAGNTLVGYATYDEVKRAVGSRLDFDDTMQRIEEKAQDVDRLFALFRQQQTELGGEVTPADKQNLRNRLKELEDELNRYLAEEYQTGLSANPKAYAQWLRSHKPFHWFIEFYGIVKSGGFDVIIGNPPYVEYSKVTQDYTVRGYATESCGNLYAFVMERNAALIRKRGSTGMIVPHSAICTDRMDSVQSLFTEVPTATWVSTYCIRPAKLFVGADQRLAIYITQHNVSSPTLYASRYHRWNEEFRPYLLPLVQYADISAMRFPNSLPKVHSALEQGLWHKMTQFTRLGALLPRRNGHTIYFHNSPRYWIRAMDYAPYFWNERDGEQISTQVKSLHLATPLDASVVVATLNGSLFYWWFVVLSDCRHLNLREIENFPLGLERMSETIKRRLTELTDRLMADLKRHAQRKEAYYQTTGQVVYDEFYPKHSKPLIDEIDRVLASHYGFTDEELDFIVNYDIKYRMGREAGEDSDQ